MDSYTLILSYFAVINIVTISVYGWDKFCAQNHRWRVSELTLLFMAAIGGSLGALVAMKLFRHKTLHLKFKYGVPLILILQILALIYCKF